VSDEYSPFSVTLAASHCAPSRPATVDVAQRAERKAADGGLFTHPIGLEVRCSLGNDRNLLKSQLTKTPDEARAIAEDWKQHALSNGYTEVKGGE
jgi:hypothetical protein